MMIILAHLPLFYNNIKLINYLCIEIYEGKELDQHWLAFCQRDSRTVFVSSFDFVFLDRVTGTNYVVNFF